jgi:hypothetical protein
MGELAQTGKLDQIVEGTPEAYLDAFYEYFVRDFGHQGQVFRQENNVSFVQKDTIWTILFTQQKRVSVWAFPEGENQTKLTVVSQRADYTRTLDGWIEDELPNKV